MINIKNIEDQYGLNLFAKRGIILVRGEKASVWDDTGKKYIDCTAGHGVAGIGHANPAVVDALTEQAKTLITCTGSFYNPVRAQLMEKLISISPSSLSKVFLCNSGTESVEAALKFARLSSGKKEFITAMRGFHGRTMGALSATYNPKYRTDFEPLVPGFHFVPFNNYDAILKTVNNNTAGILLEVIQGEGGVHSGTREYFSQVQKLCNERNIFLIIDEVQTGFGRTGKMFACEHFNIQPDILCLSKAIAGGFPMGAVLCSEKVKISTGKHGTTFGGNPLACAVSLATLDVILKNNLVKDTEEKGKHFSEKFAKYDLKIVREVRQIGLMIGIELKENSKKYINDLQNESILVLAAGQLVIRLLPPLIISYEEIDIVIEKLAGVLGG
ncbi:MAG: acetylornithine/succinylornithine family transaminase [Calditrichia bacterium]|nr:acetylornithine/succinylornithine family transaminase [Calditrichia bacterium]